MRVSLAELAHFGILRAGSDGKAQKEKWTET
jgi:hypothetical protein